MKLPNLIISGLCLAIGVSSCSTKKNQAEADQPEALFEYPENVMAIVDSKCMGCHNPDSKNDKAKEELIWAELPTMKKVFLGKKLYAIQEVLDADEMPPEKFLAKYPDKKLTPEESAIIYKWTEEVLTLVE